MNADEVIHQEIAALNGAQRGTIRIGTYLSCSIHWIPKIIREFQQKHPDIIIQVIEGVEGELADWIQERRVDIGFISLQKNHKYQFLPVMNDPCMMLFRSCSRKRSSCKRRRNSNRSI
ncbi:MAG: LysR family transcriptional regulator substrate-binding protein [Coprococcus comes]